MVQSISFQHGKAHWRSRYVNTTGYAEEQEAGKMLYRGMMGSTPPGDRPQASYRFKNPSNTNVYFWGGKLLSCWESGIPYELDPRSLKTIGKTDLNGAISESKCLAAHFKVDPARKRLVTLRYL
jgi:all-trans-8'-apo-beta-carotenal 15,15'-oxygenase